MVPARCVLIFAVALFLTIDIAKSQFYVKSLPKTVKLNNKAVHYADIYRMFHHIFGFSKFSDNVKDTKMFARPLCIAFFTFESQLPELISQYDTKLSLVQSDEVPSSMPFKSYLDQTFGVDRSLFIEAGSSNSLSGIKEKYSSLLVNFPNSKEEILAKVPGLKVDLLLADNKNALTFIAELRTLLHITEKLASFGMAKDGIPDFFNFQIQTINESIDDGKVKKVLDAYIAQMTSNLQKAYHNNCAVFLVNLNKPVHHRQARSLLAVAAAPTAAPIPATLINLSPSYDDNYPVFFNIILWTLVVLALTIYAIGYGIWTMDPGKDSIIYRMTTTRLKKD